MFVTIIIIIIIIKCVDEFVGVLLCRLIFWWVCQCAVLFVSVLVSLLVCCAVC